MTVLVGANFYPAQGDAARRQRGAIAALGALCGAIPVNLQWADTPFHVEGVATVAALHGDAVLVTGRPGPRKPIVSEMLHTLAREAATRGCHSFLFANADIELSPAVIALIERTRRDGYAFARTEIDPVTRAATGMMDHGVDAFAFAVSWWERHGHRFRPYIAGEAIWDNAYAAIMLTHADGEFVRQPGLIAHERHDVHWVGSSFADYIAYLAALDRPYFSLWARFHAELSAAAPGELTPERIRQLCDRVFRPEAVTHSRVLQLARVAKARVQLSVRNLRWKA